MEGREAKDRLYEESARTAKALASPKRVELVELLAQGEHTVEGLAQATGMGVTNTLGAPAGSRACPSRCGP